MNPRPALVVSGLIVLVLSLSFPFLGNTLYVVGGEYILRRGEVMDGDLTVVLARLTVEDGAQVQGDLIGLSSDLDIHGAVTGNILSIESEATVQGSCEIGGAQHAFDLLNYVILIPEIARLRVRPDP